MVPKSTPTRRRQGRFKENIARDKYQVGRYFPCVFQGILGGVLGAWAKDPGPLERIEGQCATLREPLSGVRGPRGWIGGPNGALRGALGRGVGFLGASERISCRIFGGAAGKSGGSFGGIKVNLCESANPSLQPIWLPSPPSFCPLTGAAHSIRAVRNEDSRHAHRQVCRPFSTQFMNVCTLRIMFFCFGMMVSGFI